MSETDFSLDSTVLKILGVIFMTTDHIGYFLFPQITVLRIIGRLAYPIFAYMIAEGCRYTRNKVRYFFTMFGIAFVCSAVSYFADKSMYQSIFTTFSCSVTLIFSLEKSIQSRDTVKKIKWIFITAGITICYLFLFEFNIIPGFETDYGFLGIITPVFIWLGRNKAEKLILLAVGLCLISAELGGVQLYSLAAVILLWLYNGKRGKHSFKWFFYGYYPLHIAALYGVAQFIS